MAKHAFKSLEEMEAHLGAFEETLLKKPRATAEAEVMLWLSSASLRPTAEVRELRGRVSQLERQIQRVPPGSPGSGAGLP